MEIDIVAFVVCRSACYLPSIHERASCGCMRWLVALVGGGSNPQGKADP
jgi:hypothetical protein